MAPRGNTSPELFSPSPEGGSRYAGGPGRGAAGRQSGGVQPKTGRDPPQDGRPPPENRGPGARTFGRDYLDNETVNPIRFRYHRDQRNELYKMRVSAKRSGRN